MAFTAAQYNLIQQMIDASIDKEFEDCSFADMSDIRGCESYIEELENRINGIENDGD